MRRNPASEGSDAYEFKMTIFENGELKELLQSLKSLNKTIDGTAKTIVAVRVNSLCILLRLEVLQDFDNLIIQKNGTTNDHLR